MTIKFPAAAAAAAAAAATATFSAFAAASIWCLLMDGLERELCKFGACCVAPSLRARSAISAQ